MELTPDLLLEAKFAPARRGYDMHEVDDFLERCAEGLDVLLTRLKAEFERAELAEERAAAAEARAAGTPAPATSEPAAEAPVEAAAEAAPEVAPEPAPAAPMSEGQVAEPMRILLAAERTAEAAVAEARAEAEQIRAEAETVASTARSEAESLLARSRAEAEAEAREAGEEARRAIEAEVLSLRADRDVLSSDVRSLRSWLDGQRERMRTTARDLQRLVDDPDAFGTPDEPQLAFDDAPAAQAPADVDDDEEEHMVVLDDGEPTQAVPVFDGRAEEEDVHSTQNGHAGASPIR